MRNRKGWKEYPLRRCRWLNGCCVCGKDIVSGELYYDGGYSRRAHKLCVDIMAKYSNPDTRGGTDERS